MNPLPVGQVCVIGAGTAGVAISLRCALQGIPTRLVDRSRTALERARLFFGRHQAAAPRTGSRLILAADLAAAVRDAGLVIECVRESVAVKRKLFEALNLLAPSHAVFATNSSCVPVSRLERASGRPDRVLNMHFFLPFAPVVELMSGTSTSPETLAAARDFAERLGLFPLTVRKERVGFALNRVWWCIKNECLRLVDEGVVTHEDIDRAWMAMWKLPIGPFGLMDQVGLDTVRDVHVAFQRESGSQDVETPAVLLRRLDAGQFGAKSGRGFYRYPHPKYARAGFSATGGLGPIPWKNGNS